MDQKRQLLIDVAIGEEADRFWQSDLGQHMIQANLNQIAALHERFEAIDPLDTKDLQKVHFEIRVARYGIKKLNEIIAMGRQAYDALSEEQGS